MIKLLKRSRQHKIMLALIVVFVIGFIAAGGMESKAASQSPYLIKVNKQQNCVTVYEKDEEGKYTVPIKAMVCSTGYATPTGTYQTPQKLRWHILMGDVWGQYCTRINKGVLFHSVWYYEKDPSTVSGTQYNKLGTTCSHGCVRLAVVDAKWIYNNCPIGTTVVIYNDSDPGPLGKPKAIKITNAKGWDPTDTDASDNPYNDKEPTISGAKNQTITYGSVVRVMNKVTAKNTTGYDATSKIKVSIKFKGKAVDSVDSKIPGKYAVTYKVTDEIKRTVSVTVVFNVKTDSSAPVLVGVKDLLVKGGVTIDRDFVMKNVTAKQSGEAIAKSKITAEITQKSDSLYLVEYSVTAKNGKTTTATAKVVVDSQAPVLTGTNDKEIAWDTVVNESLALEGVTVTDDNAKLSTKNIKVTITDNKNNTYTITYTVSDEVGNTTQAEATYTITDFLKIEGAKDLTLPVGTIVNSNYALQQGVKAYNGAQEITYSMVVTVSEPVNNQYTVTFSVSDAAGHKETVIVTYTVQTVDPVSTVAPSATPSV